MSIMQTSTSKTQGFYVVRVNLLQITRKCKTQEEVDVFCDEMEKVELDNIKGGE